MGKTALPFLFIFGAHMVPNIDRGNGCLVVFVHQKR